jgi:hypothetical protein
LGSDTEKAKGWGGRRFKSHANEKSNVDISLGGVRACDGPKLEHQRGSSECQLRRTAVTFTEQEQEQEHLSAVPILLVSSWSTRCFTLFCSTLLTMPLLFCSARICALTRILVITALQKAAFSRSSASQFLLCLPPQPWM